MVGAARLTLRALGKNEWKERLRQQHSSLLSPQDTGRKADQRYHATSRGNSPEWLGETTPAGIRHVVHRDAEAAVPRRIAAWHEAPRLARSRGANPSGASDTRVGQ